MYRRQLSAVPAAGNAASLRAPCQSVQEAWRPPWYSTGGLGSGGGEKRGKKKKRKRQNDTHTPSTDSQKLSGAGGDPRCSLHLPLFTSGPGSELSLLLLCSRNVSFLPARGGTARSVQPSPKNTNSATQTHTENKSPTRGAWDLLRQN